MREEERGKSEVRGVGRSQNTQGFVNQSKEFIAYFKCNGKPLESFKQRTDLI